MGQASQFSATTLAVASARGAAVQCLLQAESRECTRITNQPVQDIVFNLLIRSASLLGPGLLTVSVDDTPLRRSRYIYSTDRYTYVDLGKLTLEQQNPSRSFPSSPATALQMHSVTNPSRSALGYTTPLPLSQALASGGAIQLQHLGRGTQHYAVSATLLAQLLRRADSQQQLQFCTPFADSLSYWLGLTSPVLPTSSTPPSTGSQMLQPQQGKLPDLSSVRKQQPLFALAPWVLCFCLCCSTIALALGHRRQAAKANSNATAETSSLHTEESFCIRSRMPLATPMKDTGCSPFVPVNQTAMPPPALPCHQLASCSSKIGSYKTPAPRGAKPTASKAHTTQTNTSSRSKWQRDRNGRLASAAAQENDSAMDEFTSSRSRKHSVTKKG